MSDHDLLVQLLTKIDNEESITVVNEQYDRTHPLIAAVIYIADDYLTTESGYYNIHELKKVGFDIYPVEQDRFGWLMGGIRLRRGVIVFG